MVTGMHTFNPAVRDDLRWTHFFMFTAFNQYVSANKYDQLWMYVNYWIMGSNLLKLLNLRSK